MTRKERDKKRSRLKTALVLSGGGSRGAVEVGVMKVVLKMIEPDAIIGTSVGAINAAAIAAGDDTETLEEVWLRMTSRVAFPFNWQIFYLYGRIMSISHPFRLKSVLEKVIPVKTFEECKTPLFINATKMLNGESVMFDSGNIIDAVLASAAIPPYYPPYEIDGVKYIDGGVSNAIAIEQAKALGCKQVIVVSTYGEELSSNIWNVFRLTGHALDLVLRSKLQNEVELETKSFSKQNVVFISPHIPSHISITNFEHTKELIAIGEREARKHVHKIHI